jgi:hypothetical protein
MEKNPKKWLVPVLLSAVVVGIFVFFWTQLNRPVPTPAPAIEPATEMTEPSVAEQPAYPVPDETAVEPEIMPLPALDNSDAEFAAGLMQLFSDKDVGRHLATDNIIVRTVTTIDNLSNPRIAERLRPVVGLQGQFMAEPVWGQGDDPSEFTLSPANFARYDWLISQLAAMSTEELAAMYQHYYPLFQQAYVELGYPEGYFNDRLIVVIDHLLATPRVGEPIRLNRPHVLYQFADPRLEALSSGQKILIRMGDKNATVVKTKLRELRGLVGK